MLEDDYLAIGIAETKTGEVADRKKEDLIQAAMAPPAASRAASLLLGATWNVVKGGNSLGRAIDGGVLKQGISEVVKAALMSAGVVTREGW
jgi:hypothetical protein